MAFWDSSAYSKGDAIPITRSSRVSWTDLGRCATNRAFCASSLIRAWPMFRLEHQWHTTTKHTRPHLDGRCRESGKVGGPGPGPGFAQIGPFSAGLPREVVCVHKLFQFGRRTPDFRLWGISNAFLGPRLPNNTLPCITYIMPLVHTPWGCMRSTEPADVPT